jgi:hypothetical protein
VIVIVIGKSRYGSCADMDLESYEDWYCKAIHVFMHVFIHLSIYLCIHACIPWDRVMKKYAGIYLWMEGCIAGIYRVTMMEGLA